MPKFVQADGIYSMLFTFDQNAEEAGRYYLPNEPWLKEQEFYALSIVSPDSISSNFQWDGKDFTYANLDQLRQMYFTLLDNNEDEIIRDGIPLDYIKTINSGQVRTFKSRNIWPNRSYIKLTANGVITPNVTALIFQIWYKQK